MSYCSWNENGEELQFTASDETNEKYCHRRAVSSGEPSLDGSADEERAALSDSDLAGVARIQTECRTEQSLPLPNGDCSTSTEEWNDVLGSGQLFCKVLKVGKGPKARNGQKVTIRVVDTKLAVDNVNEKTFVLGFSMVIDAWEMVLQLMHEGEIDAIKSEHRFAYGSVGDPGRNIPPYQTMEYEIELVCIADGPLYTTLQTNELVKYITELKERGNYFYNRKELEKAIYVYKRSTELIDLPTEDEALQHLFSVIYSNLSVCYAKLCDWKLTLDASSAALNLNASNTKALFRRANAYANLNFIEEAIDTLNTAHQIDPNDELIIKELRRLKARLKLCREQERSLYKRMLAGAHGDNEHRTYYIHRLRYLLLAFFIIVFALFIHFLRIVMGW
ncbi:Peptidyl-prolyl cis-trans isomerase FKBP8 [Dirofilaria immitis]|nr:Binding protein [Dirofilaria immitis]